MRWMNLSSSALVLSGVGAALLLGAGWRMLAAPKQGNDPANVLQHASLAPEVIEARKRILDQRVHYCREVDSALKDWTAQRRTLIACCDHLLLLSLTDYPEFLAGLDDEPGSAGRTAHAKIAHYLAATVNEYAEVYFAGAPHRQAQARNDLAELVREANPMARARPMSISSLENAAPADAPKPPHTVPVMGGAAPHGASLAP